jgi:hypothetical protein
MGRNLQCHCGTDNGCCLWASETYDQQAVACCVQRHEERPAAQAEARTTSMREKVGDLDAPALGPWRSFLRHDALLSVQGRSFRWNGQPVSWIIHGHSSEAAEEPT